MDGWKRILGAAKMILTRLSFGVAMLLAAWCGTAGAGEILKLDSEKSKIGFVGKKTDGQHVGGFKKFDAKAVADFENPSAGSLEITIDTNSLWSDDDKLTNHLKNPDFFNVRKYPQIVFKATKITANEEEAKLTGQLTMLDKTVEVTVPAKVTVVDEAIELTASFTIDRTKWGMNYGAGKIDNDVAITAVLVFER
jgi:polyisoprenoid-binding protein YceI